MTADEVLEAMAWAAHDAERQGFSSWNDLIRASSEGSAFAAAIMEMRRNQMRAAIRALPAGWVVAKVPEPKGELQVGKTSGVYAIAAAIVCTYDAGYDAALDAVRASAVEVK